MRDYAPDDPFRSTPVPSNDSDGGGQGKNTNPEGSDELRGQTAYPTPQASQGQPTPSRAGLAAANTDFNCHDNPLSEIACIKNHIRGIQNWSETFDDREPIRDMLVSLEEIIVALDLMEVAMVGDEADSKCFTKRIIQARKEVVRIGLRAKKMEVVQKHEQVELMTLEAMVKEFVGETRR